MEFKDKLGQLLGLCDCKMAELSRESGINSSVLCRYNSGDRIPAYNDEKLKKIADAFAKIAINNGKERIIMNELAVDDKFTSLEFNDSIRSYLCDGLVTKGEKSGDALSKKKLTLFSKKLLTLMQTLGVDNNRLARALNVDASLISRYRTGDRIPVAGSGIIEDMCDFFETQIRTEKQRAQIKELLEALVSKDILGREYTMKEKLRLYFSDNDDKNIFDIKSFITKFNVTDTVIRKKPSDKEGLFPPDNEKFIKKAIGERGFREMTLLFLSYVVNDPTIKTLYLYSDQSNVWLRGEASFAEQWKSLMSEILGNGTNMEFIHCIRSDETAVLSTLDTWLPFYMTGRIKPYFLNVDGKSPFCHSMFIADRKYIMHGSFVLGGEDVAQFTSSTVEEAIDAFGKQFTLLKKLSQPMTDVFTPENAQDYVETMKDIFRNANCELTNLTNTLPLFTMPKSVLLDMLDYNRIFDDERDEIIKFHESVCMNVKRILENHPCRVYMSISKPIKELTADIPHIFCKLCYNESIYARHLAATQEYSFANRNFYLNNKLKWQYPNVGIFITDSGISVVKKETNPTIAFIFKNKDIANALKNYIKKQGNE